METVKKIRQSTSFGKIEPAMSRLQPYQVDRFQDVCNPDVSDLRFQFTPAPYLVDHSIFPEGVVFMSPAAVGKTTTANLQMMFYANLLRGQVDEINFIRKQAQLQRFVDHQWPANRVAAAAVRHALENWK